MSESPSNRTSRDEVERVLGLEGGGMSAGFFRRKWLLLAIVVLAVAAAAAYLFVSGETSATGQYLTEQAARRDVVAIVTATGTVEPTNQVEISSELSGIVRKVMVDHNSRVEVGDVLAELNTDKLEASVASSRARVAAARAQVSEAEATLAEMSLALRRKRDLAESQITPQQELEAAQAAYDRARATLTSARADAKAAEADLRLDETNLEKACICSPIDGVVLSRNVDPGQVVASSLQAPVLFTIAENLSQMEVRVDVDEADVGQVREGQRATFTVDAYPERKFSAEISELRFGSEVVQGVVTYKAVLTTDNSELLLRPGMTATSEITVQEKRDVLTIPNQALRFTPPVAEEANDRSLLQLFIPRMPRFREASRSELTGSERDVWVLRDGVATSLALTVGISDGRWTEITGGPIEEGEEIIVDTAEGGA